MEFYDKNAEPRYKVGINMKKIHNMDEVMKAIEDAKMAYDEKAQKGFFAPLRKAFRKLGKNQETCKAWLDLLPGDSEYFSIICGGLKLILGVSLIVFCTRDLLTRNRQPNELAKSTVRL
jgi:hypothetical protein